MKKLNGDLFYKRIAEKAEQTAAYFKDYVLDTWKYVVTGEADYYGDKCITVKLQLFFWENDHSIDFDMFVPIDGRKNIYIA